MDWLRAGGEGSIQKLLVSANSLFYLSCFACVWYCETKYHGMVSLKIEDDTSSAKANKKAEVSVINQAQPQINAISTRKTEIPQADKAELASEASSRRQVWNLLFSQTFLPSVFSHALSQNELMLLRSEAWLLLFQNKVKKIRRQIRMQSLKSFHAI